MFMIMKFVSSNRKGNLEKIVGNWFYSFCILKQIKFLEFFFTHMQINIFTYTHNISPAYKI